MRRTEVWSGAKAALLMRRRLCTHHTPSSCRRLVCLHSKFMKRAMTADDRKVDAPDLLAMKQASVARMLATAKALHDEGELRPMPLPAHVSPPAAEPLRVMTRK